MTIIVVVVLVSLVVAVAIADLKLKSESVHSIGVIQSESKYYIMSPFSGEVDEIYVTEGQIVENGDKLIDIGAAEYKAQHELYSKQADYYFGILEGYYRMYEKIKTYGVNSRVWEDSRNENPFNANSERMMYLSYQNFLRQMVGIEGNETTTLEESRQLYLDQSLMSCYQMIMQYEPTYKQILYQEDYFQTLIDERTITADKNGILHFETILNTGMVVSPGTLLFSVSGATDDDSMIVNLQIPAAYRPYLSVGYKTQMEIAGYPSEAYGKLNGVIAEISSDSNVDSNGNVWFTAKVVIDNSVTSGKAGSAHVVNGMIVSASIIYEESTWLDWILKGFGL